ncbi:MAG: hypothetical protein WKG00_09065 [Polyangiaceae bacterium]
MRLRAAMAAFLASTLVLGSAFGQETDPKKLADAKKHMEAGAVLYNDPSGHKCEEALREFRQAYELSGSLNALKAMGVCELEVERDGDALAHFETFLQKLGDKPHPDKAQVESDLKGLKAAVAWVTLTSDRQNVRVVDVRTPSRGYPITNRYAVTAAAQKIGVHPGQHVFTASSDGAPDQTWKVDIGNASTHERSFAFDTGKPITADGFTSSDLPGGDTTKPATTTERPVPTTVWIFGGLTAALAVPTVIFMVRAGGKRGDYDDANGTLSGPEAGSKLEDMRSDVQSANLVADIFLGATIASAAATAIFYFTRPEVQVQSGAAGGALRLGSGPKPGIFLTPAAGPTGGGAALSGRF